MESSIAGLFSRDGLPIEEMDIDALITIGGDGTILRSIQRTEAPIFGINAGVLGFLTDPRGQRYRKESIGAAPGEIIS